MTKSGANFNFLIKSNNETIYTTATIDRTMVPARSVVCSCGVSNDAGLQSQSRRRACPPKNDISDVSYDVYDDENHKDFKNYP